MKSDSKMPLDEGSLSFDLPKTDKPRESILKLGRMITDRIGVKIDGNSPEYWGLCRNVSDEMAELALKMKVRKPKTFEQLLALSKLEPDVLQKLLDEMAMIGLIEYNNENLDGKNPKHERRYVLPPFVPGSAEFLNMRTDMIDATPEVAAFFERMTFMPLEKITPMVPPGGSGIGMHVIPVEKAIQSETHSASVEHISHWLEKYADKYALSLCSCRASREKLGEGCGDDPEGWCIAVGDMADYIVDTHRGRYATYEEVMDTLQKAEDNGFVHQITNIDGDQKIFAICNCNVNICNALRTSQLFNTPNMSRSAYVAHVDADACTACGQCVEYCPAGAVKLGQKLCTSHGFIEYPKHDLPDDLPWGPERWDIHYRDTNRINCYDTGTSPCKSACPAHISIQGYLKLAAQGKFEEALELIKKHNPFPAVCGRICNRRCEDACTRGTLDEAVAIDEVKKFLAELDLKQETRLIPKKIVPSLEGAFDDKIAVIGAGPAGLSCAYYLALMGYKPTVFEKNEKAGGMLCYGIPAYKLDQPVIESEIAVLKELGVQIITGVEIGRDKTLQDLRNEGYAGFYAAIGCQKGNLPRLKGIDAKGVCTAVDYLHAAAEDKNLRHAEDTVVIGGGNVAVDAACVSRLQNPDGQVQMVCLEAADQMPASAEEIEEAKELGVQIVNGWGVKDIQVRDDRVCGIVLQKCTQVFDENGRFAPLYDQNDTKEIVCSRIIFSIGQAPLYGHLFDGEDLEFDARSYPISDRLSGQTSVPDLFVGGDVQTGPAFAIDAIAAGHEGAISLHRFVQNASLSIGRNRRDFIELDKSDILIAPECYDRPARQHPIHHPERKMVFEEYIEPLSAEQVMKETSRCLACGASVVDVNKCIGCGLCTTKCKFDAIHLSRDLPEASVMRSYDDKLKGVIPYAAKRQIRISKRKRAEQKAAKESGKKSNA